MRSPEFGSLTDDEQAGVIRQRWLGKGYMITPGTMLEAIVVESPSFIEARVSLATVYYRLKLRDLGDKERAVVEELNRQAQARQPGAAPSLAQPVTARDAPTVMAHSLRRRVRRACRHLPCGIAFAALCAWPQA